MMTQAISLRQVPNQRLFSTRAAAQYLGVSQDTLRKYADLGDVQARQLVKRRVFRLEDLDAFIDNLPLYRDPGYTVGGGKPGSGGQSYGS